jgi:Fe-Mn family superoxide dismutase
MEFKLPALPYPANALEPHIDARTMEIHHGKHHAGYVSKLNEAIAGRADLPGTVEGLCAAIGKVPADIRTAVRNNAGGHYNHSLFWTIMAPRAGGQPAGELAAAITRTFGSFDAFKGEFAKAATGRFGSGWAWLGIKPDGALCVCSTPNQDNPLMTGVAECPCTPILGLDVWEHAYYLNHQNRRPDYVAAWWNVVSWPAVAKRYADARTTVAAR